MMLFVPVAQSKTALDHRKALHQGFEITTLSAALAQCFSVSSYSAFRL
jgi:hypothetical protein